MFRKLIKYDFKSSLKICRLLTILGVCAGIFAVITLRLIPVIITSGSGTIATLVGVPMVLLEFFLIFGSILLIGVVPYILYYKAYRNMFTDEGYLTFTLPVSRKQVFNSKYVVMLVWGLITTVALFVIFGFALLVIPTIDTSNIVTLNGFKVLFRAIGDFAELVGIGWFIGYVFEFIIITFVSWFFGTSLVMFCITVGSIVAKKYKLLCAVGIYVGTVFVCSIVSEIISLAVTIYTPFDVFEKIAAAGPVAINLVLNGIIILIIAVIAVVGFLFYRSAIKKIENKLNLA